MSDGAKITRTASTAAILADARRRGARINLAGAEKGVEIARALCPVSDNNEPGHVHLRDTIEVVVDERTGSAMMVAGDPERGVNHAELVEFGGVFTGAQPYFYPGRVFGKKAAERAANAERHTR